GAELDVDTHGTGHASRSWSAASAGFSMFTNTPVPSSKPAIVEMRVTTVTYQWNGWSPRAGPLCTITLYGTAPSTDSSAPTARRVARATASSASLGASSNVGPASAAAMRIS